MLATWSPPAPFFLLLPLAPLQAAEDSAGADFESLYQHSMGAPSPAQDPARDNLELDLDAAVQGLASKPEEPDPLDEEGMDDGRDRSLDLAKEEGDWEVAPVVLGRRQDGAASDSEVLAPLGIEFVRDF